MKNTIFILSMSFLFLTPTFSQGVESEKPMSLGLKNGLSFEIKDLKVSKAEDLWQDFMKQFDCKTKKDKKLGEFFSDNAKVYYIPTVSSIDVYARFAERGKSVDASFFFLETDHFLSSKLNADQMKGAGEFVRQFDVYVQKYQTKEKLEDEQKKLKKFESDLKKLAKDNDSLHKDIENYQDKIKKAEAEITKNLADQEATNKIIIEQARMVDQVKSHLEGLK
jgi:translation initiation factor 2B subunit (eIF-2B alpha/beta/delta family)